MARPKKKTTSNEIKQRGLFDHINHIRQVKSSDYISTLNETELKSFNPYMICRFLSMDSSIIEEIALVSKYFDKMDVTAFYKLCCEITPANRGFFPFIKNKSTKFNKELLEYVSKKFDVSVAVATEYCKIFYSTITGTNELKSILRGYGLTDKEIDKIVTIKE